MIERIKYTCKLGKGEYIRRSEYKIVAYLARTLLGGTDPAKVLCSDFLPEGLTVAKDLIGEGKTPDAGSIDNGKTVIFSCPVKEWHDEYLAEVAKEKKAAAEAAEAKAKEARAEAAEAQAKVDENPKEESKDESK